MITSGFSIYAMTDIATKQTIHFAFNGKFILPKLTNWHEKLNVR